MIIHFICRGNCFRSIIAEAYLNSLGVKDTTAMSSGTVAAAEKADNRAYFQSTLDLLDRHGIRAFAKAGHGDQLTQSRLAEADMTVCLNQRVYDECLQRVTFTGHPRIWSVADVGEPGRIPTTDAQRELYREEAYQEITRNVDLMITKDFIMATIKRNSHSRTGFYKPTNPVQIALTSMNARSVASSCMHIQRT